jgi:hypothetical protein
MENQVRFSSASEFSSVFGSDVVPRPFEFAETNNNRIERLPFSIRIAKNEEDVLKAVAIRHSSYARHVPQLARNLAQPEPADFEDGVSVLLAESKLDGRPLGTMRLQTNQFRPLALEASVALPRHFDGLVLAEATRLGVTQEKVGRVVTNLLFKAYLMHCLNAGIDWMVITARSPMDKRYEALLLEDVFPGRGYIPMHHVGDIPHRVMALDVAALKGRWARIDHPLYELFFLTNHPDIDVDHTNHLPTFLHDFEYKNSVVRSHSASQ